MRRSDTILTFIGWLQTSVTRFPTPPAQVPSFITSWTINLASIQSTKGCGSGGIRTHAPEETGALNQRLRPLGHATECILLGKKKAPASQCQGHQFGSPYTFTKICEKWLSEVGFEPTPSYEDQNSHTLYYRARSDPWVWRLRPLGHPDNIIDELKFWDAAKQYMRISNNKSSFITKHLISHHVNKTLAERSFDLRTSGLWAQHASTAPLCYHNY